MKLVLHVDTNDYNEPGDEGTVNETETWSLMGLKFKTLQDWKGAGQTGYWTVDGESFCGSKYECELNWTGMDGELLLRVLVKTIKDYCGERYMHLYINDMLVGLDDDGTMFMRPEWVNEFQQRA